jgi:hypothetical protein
LSGRNIAGVEIFPASQFNTYTVLRPKRLLLTKAALDELCDNAKWNISGPSAQEEDEEEEETEGEEA